MNFSTTRRFVLSVIAAIHRGGGRCLAQSANCPASGLVLSRVMLLHRGGGRLQGNLADHRGTGRLSAMRNDQGNEQRVCFSVITTRMSGYSVFSY